jgi:hypothetical protein
MTDPIKAKIQELCPDVMELKFGCQLLGEDGTTLDFVPYLMTWSLERLPHILASSENEFINFQTKEILGSPITLAVVLRAIQKERGIKQHDTVNFYSTDADWVLKVIMYWNLEHDDYDQQSDECKQFIGSLLGL